MFSLRKLWNAFRGFKLLVQNFKASCHNLLAEQDFFYLFFYLDFIFVKTKLLSNESFGKQTSGQQILFKKIGEKICWLKKIFGRTFFWFKHFLVKKIVGPIISLVKNILVKEIFFLLF